MPPVALSRLSDRPAPDMPVVPRETDSVLELSSVDVDEESGWRFGFSMATGDAATVASLVDRRG